VTQYTAIFCHNLYKYACGGGFNKKGEQMIRMGCYNRTRKEWELDFWNNPSEFKNDGSEKSEARLRAFKVICFFLDSITKPNLNEGEYQGEQYNY
jgi:hypothetical protein